MGIVGAAGAKAMQDEAIMYRGTGPDKVKWLAGSDPIPPVLTKIRF